MRGGREEGANEGGSEDEEGGWREGEPERDATEDMEDASACG